MRILIIQETDWLKRGPHDHHHLAEKLSIRGHQIHVIDHELLWRAEGKRELYSRRQVFGEVSKIYQGGRVTLIRPGIMKIRIPGLDYLSLIFSHRREIERQIREFAPDAIISLGILNSYLAMRAANKNSIPFVYYWGDVPHLLIPFKCFRPLGKFVEGKTLRHTGVALATNKRLRARLVEIGAHPGRAYVLSHGIDFERFNPELVSGSKVREQYGIGQDDVVITYIGRLSRITGVREVAFDLSKVDNSQLKFLVVGTGSREGELRQMQQGLELQEKMIITGRRPYEEIPGLVAASDICLLPFHNVELMRDIVPIKILDYMAMGKPVISTRLPGVVEEFGENNGIIYVDKPEDVVNKAIELAAQRDLAELGAKAREFVAGSSWDSTTDELERILTEAVRKKQMS